MVEVVRSRSQKLERLDGKLSRVVLRGEGCGDVCPPTRQAARAEFELIDRR
jgi:hypothetical protein